MWKQLTETTSHSIHISSEWSFPWQILCWNQPVGWQVNKEFRLEVLGTNWLISLSDTLRFWCRCDGVKQNLANFPTLTKLIVTFGNRNDPEQSIFWKSTRTSSEHHHCSWFTINEKLETVNSWKYYFEVPKPHHGKFVPCIQPNFRQYYYIQCWSNAFV